MIYIYRPFIMQFCLSKCGVPRSESASVVFLGLSHYQSMKCHNVDYHCCSVSMHACQPSAFVYEVCTSDLTCAEAGCHVTHDMHAATAQPALTSPFFPCQHIRQHPAGSDCRLLPPEMGLLCLLYF